MTPKPLISVVVATYNYARFLRDCLSSVLNQDGGHSTELVLVDDASTDDTQELVGSLSDPRVRYIRHEQNRGLIATMNEGFALASGTFIARLDADDRYRPNYFQEALSIFKQHPDVGLVYADAAAIDGDGTIISELWEDCGSNRAHKGADHKGREFIALLTDNFIPTPTVMARRAVWQDGLPLPPDLAPTLNDWYLNLKLARNHTFYYRARPLAEYRIHSSNMTRTPRRDTFIEQSIFAILDEVFGSEELRSRRRLRRAVYAHAYLRLATQYFGMRMTKDSRRCFLRASSFQPQALLCSGHLRRFLATVFGQSRYEACKQALLAWNKKESCSHNRAA